MDEGPSVGRYRGDQARLGQAEPARATFRRAAEIIDGLEADAYSAGLPTFVVSQGPGDGR